MATTPFANGSRWFPMHEELSLKYGMSHPRLMFFHDLFESFLPVKEERFSTVLPCFSHPLFCRIHVHHVMNHVMDHVMNHVI